MEIKKASKYSIYNMAELANSNLAGCYYCKSIFNAIEIKETADDGKTALCPKCGFIAYFPNLRLLNLILKHCLLLTNIGSK
tara:strand:+ start:484 stop:726 length:243 start_codon:yes stop_codon:yes gene_type:complete